MPYYEISSDGFFYLGDSGQQKCIISFWEFYTNKGAIPLHTYSEGKNTIRDALIGLRDAYRVMTAGVQSNDDELAFTLMAGFIFAESLLGYRPMNILLASEDESYADKALLAAAAKRAHPKSRLYELCFSSSAPPPRQNFFDIVIFGAGSKHPHTNSVLSAARKGGLLIFRHTDGQPQIEGDEYALSGNSRLYTRRADGAGEKGPAAQSYGELRDRLRLTLANEDYFDGPTEEGLKAAVSLLGGMEKAVLSLFDISDPELKQRVNEAKENALICLYAKDDGYRDACFKKLMDFILSA